MCFLVIIFHPSTSEKVLDLANLMFFSPHLSSSTSPMLQGLQHNLFKQLIILGKHLGEICMLLTPRANPQNPQISQGSTLIKFLLTRY